MEPVYELLGTPSDVATQFNFHEKKLRLLEVSSLKL